MPAVQRLGILFVISWQKQAMMFPGNTILMMRETKLIILRFLLKLVISKHLAWTNQMPENGYHGEDIIGIGKDLADEFGDKFVEMDEKERFDAIP